MNRTHIKTTLLLLLSLLLSSGVNAKQLNREQAAHQAQHQYGGKVLSVRLKKPVNKAPFYAIKLLKQGRVRIVRIKKRQRD
ncbi:MAG: hypothetical protein Q9N68_04705 [Gammaproteobacteria bacterium]|nr:hypothetical protein [Gammaproteobacteria bacterium]